AQRDECDSSRRVRPIALPGDAMGGAMARQLVTEEAVPPPCLQAAARGTPTRHLLREYPLVNLLRDRESADRAASHRTEEEPGEWWVAAGAPPPAGRPRAVS